MVEDEWAARLKRHGIPSIRQIRSAEGGRVCRPWRGSGEVGVLVPRADALGYESAALRARGRGLPSRGVGRFAKVGERSAKAGGRLAKVGGRSAKAGG